MVATLRRLTDDIILEMSAKKRVNNSVNWNFRPNDNGEQKPTGTKPTREPTSIKEIFLLMVLHVCKKSLFFNTNLKIALYLGCLFLVSLIADVLPFPKMYLSRSDNIFNRVFVKFAWGWNLVILLPFVIFTSLVYCCGDKQKIAKHHLLRIGIATFFWWFWTTLFNYVEASFGKCGNLKFPTKGTCLRAGHLWNGFDLSGHSFILIYGSLFLIEEARCIMNWDSIRDSMRLEEYNRTAKQTIQQSSSLCNLDDTEFSTLKCYYEKYTPYIKGLFIVIAVFQIMWDFMLLSTILYYHVMIEKFLGGLSAVLTWYVTYRMWYCRPNAVPKMPGEGSFKYAKGASKPVLRRNASFSDNRHPIFKGRVIFTKAQEDSIIIGS
ncbi:hypothetical protein NQ318_001922 [Aromia moschata]|uniref:Uncharacterized protein n=1 Tax=Aromia moschata TaxID=1265417 RepID=A0AAV8Z224_9CUCU|nr:hypothetical protein NQ318_001922 [Aromia moschata]